jgi:release factor glutamine methyltransferase
MKLFELLKQGENMLQAAGISEARIDAELLWQHISGQSKADMLMSMQQQVLQGEEHRYFELVDVRRKRFPLQYITGVQYFYGMEFKVSKNVLIPRYDTETLVETALSLAKKKSDIEILDLCCGSGCIGITCGMIMPDSQVTLVDISPDAIKLTKDNIEKLAGDEAGRFKVLSSNLFEKIQDKFDFILSNPPYIKSEVIETLMPEVKDYEPRLALDGTEDGLYFYRAIVKDAEKYLKDDGYVVFEIGNDQTEDVQHLLVDAGYTDVCVKKDLCGNDRVVYGKRRYRDV